MSDNVTGLLDHILKKTPRQLDERSTLCCGGLTLTRRSRNFLSDQIDLRERGFPNLVDQFVEPDQQEHIGIPWLLQKLLDRMLDKEFRLRDRKMVSYIGKRELTVRVDKNTYEALQRAAENSEGKITADEMAATCLEKAYPALRRSRSDR